MKTEALGMEAASPDLEKQSFLAVVFVNLEYSGQPDPEGKAQKIIRIYFIVAEVKSLLKFILDT